jgi:hypothetical protein
MTTHSPTFCFQQLHVDVARNATDDFNLFHDPHKWHKIRQNPFEGPIVLGFQLESLIEGQISAFRQRHKEAELIDQLALDYSNYQFTFANAVKPGQQVAIDIKPSQCKNNTLTNRIIVKTNGKLALTGFKKESQQPLFLAETDFSEFGALKPHADRSFIGNTGFFLKRKFMNTSNAKNFLCGSFIDQSQYFDELNDKADFPEIFPTSLTSCALLEKAMKNHHDFEQNPMVYTSHKLSIDKKLLRQLKSNMALHILVRELPDSPDTYECYGLIDNNAVLFRALIALASLQSILK